MSITSTVHEAGLWKLHSISLKNGLGLLVVPPHPGLPEPAPLPLLDVAGHPRQTQSAAALAVVVVVAAAHLVRRP